MRINVKNARRLIKRLESEDNPVDFNMAFWFDHNGIEHDNSEEICLIVKNHPCGTAACLAGHAALEAWESGDIDKEDSSTIRETAVEWLELDYWDAKALFHGHWGGHSLAVHLFDLTKEQAIAELSLLIGRR